jgi:hypothetical protein
MVELVVFQQCCATEIECTRDNAGIITVQHGEDSHGTQEHLSIVFQNINS